MFSACAFRGNKPPGKRQVLWGTKTGRAAFASLRSRYMEVEADMPVVIEIMTSGPGGAMKAQQQRQQTADPAEDVRRLKTALKRIVELYGNEGPGDELAWAMADTARAALGNRFAEENGDPAVL